MSNTVYTGILTADETNHFILRRNGSGILEENRIWDGYINHWTGQNICAYLHRQKDYENEELYSKMGPITNPKNLFLNKKLPAYN